MRSRRGLILGISLLFIIAATSVVLTFRAFERPPAFPTTYSEGPYGCKALYLVLKELDLPVERFRLPLKKLEAHDGVLVIIDPRRIPYAKREIKTIKEWIKKGNRLLLFQGPSAAASGKKTDKDTERKLQQMMGGMFNYWSKQFGLEVISDFDSRERASIKASLGENDEIGLINISTESRWKDVPEEWTVLAKDVKGPVLVTRELGKGRITALSDITLPANKFIGEEKNLRLVLALLLGPERPQAILFDEYHHGSVISGSLSGYIGSSVFLWVLLQCALGAVLFFYSTRARFAGRFRSLTEPQGRSTLEYVQSMANIFASCKAGGTALDAILKRFLVELSKKSGISVKKLENHSGPGDSGIARSISPATGELVARCQKAVRTDGDPETALALARRLATERERLASAKIRIPLQRR